MKQRALLLMFAITAVMMLAAPTLRAAVPFVIPIVATDDSGNTRTLAIGILATANACVDTTDQYLGYQEYELPPIPPTNVFDARLDDKSSVTNTPCYGQGTGSDFRAQVGVGQVDSFLVRVQQGTGGLPVHLTWPAGLASVATSCEIRDAVSGGTLYTVDMLTSTSFDLTIGGAENFLIIMAPIIAPNTPVYFTTLSPDSIFSEDPLKPGKSKKPVKPYKGLGGPNWSNLVSEAVIQGAFADSTIESDVAGGLVIGQAYMFLKDAAKKKWAPDKASAALYCWYRGSKFDQIKNVGKGYADLQKTLRNKAFNHTLGIARGLDSTLNPGDLGRKKLIKELKKVDSKKHANRLFQEMLAFKFNIASSALGKTPAGLGDLLYVRPGHPFDGMVLSDISALIDTQMTHWQTWGGNGGALWDSAYNALYDINRAFVGPLDTLSWEAGGEDLRKLTVAGTVDVNTVTFLALPTPFVPTVTVPRNNLSEVEEDFEDQDPEEVAGVPTAMTLYQNYPNPFNPSTTIAFRLLNASNVSIKIYSVLGQEVASVLENEDLDEGFQTVDFSAATLSSGVYFYRVEGQNLDNGERIQPAVGKMMLLK